MQKPKSRFTAWLGLVHLPAVFLLSLLQVACSGTSWKEEALQPDGSVVIVTRTVERGGRHEVGQQGSYVHQTLSFRMPTTGQSIEWVDALSPDLGNSSFLPMALDIVNGTPYVVAHPMGCLSYNKWGRPNPPYVVFKHDGNSWQRIGLEALPAVIKTPNLVFSDPDNEVKRLGTRMVSAEDIRQIIVDIRQPEFKTILREKIDYDPACIPMTSNGKGRWRATAWFETKLNLDNCLAACRQDDYDEKNCPCNSIFKGK
jgi:hypothetical protein